MNRLGLFSEEKHPKCRHFMIVKGRKSSKVADIVDLRSDYTFCAV